MDKKKVKIWDKTTMMFNIALMLFVIIGYVHIRDSVVYNNICIGMSIYFYVTFGIIGFLIGIPLWTLMLFVAPCTDNLKRLKDMREATDMIIKRSFAANALEWIYNIVLFIFVVFTCSVGYWGLFVAGMMMAFYRIIMRLISQSVSVSVKSRIEELTSKEDNEE